MGRIGDANEEALRRMFGAEPVLIDVRPAGEVMAGLDDHVLLHAGPPIEWERMCGPLRGAVAGACVLEGWAPSLAGAELCVSTARRSTNGSPPEAARDGSRCPGAEECSNVEKEL